MATNFPTSLDSFTNPTSGDNLNTSVGGRAHAAMHADINDGMEAVQAALGVSAWQTYSASFTATVTNPALGSGGGAGITSRYRVIGGVCHVSIAIKFGTSGTSAGSGTYSISLPVATTASRAIGFGMSLTSGIVPLVAYSSTTTAVTMISTNGVSAFVTSSAPAAPGVGAEYWLNLTYEV